MILIIGGVCQGKAAYARDLAGKADYKILDCRDTIWSPDMDVDVFLNVQEWIRAAVRNRDEALIIAEQLLAMHPEILTLDEVGYGIVPMEKEEREYREAVGRAGQKLAAAADIVIRMVCGIPNRIK